MNKTRYAICIFLALLIFAVVNTTLGALLTRYIDHYQLIESQQGLPVSMLNIGCIIAITSSLWVTRWIKKQHLVWLASAATVLLLIPQGFPPPFPVFSALFLLIGISVGYTDVLASSSIADLYDGKRAATMMCILHAVFGAAGIVMPLVYSVMMNAGLPWNGIYTVLFGIGACMLAYIIPVSISRARHLTLQGVVNQRFTRGDLQRFFKDQGSIMILVAIFFYAFFLSAITIWIDRYVGVGLGNKNLSALSLSLFWVGLTLSRLLTPLLNIKPPVLIRWASLATAATLVIGIALHNAPLMCATSVLAGLFSGATIPLLLHIACQKYKSNTLMATTFLFLAIYASQSIAPPIMGFIASTWGLTIAMLLCPAAVGLCGLAAFMIRAETIEA